MHLLSLLSHFYGLQKRLKHQQAFNRQWLVPLLNEWEGVHGGTFTLKQLRKISDYYALFVPVIFCTSYRLLTGKIFSESERRNAALLAVMTPLYDDFFDEAKVVMHRIQAMTVAPQSFAPSSFEEKVFCSLHLRFIKALPAQNQYEACFEKVLQSQTHSLKQMDASITYDELLRITYKKSLDALRLFWTVLEPPPLWFDDVMYEAAGLLQLSNDLFDVYKDVQSKQQTSANHHPDFDSLQQRFLSETGIFNRKLLQLPYPLKQKTTFMFTMQVIIARGYVALLHLKKAWVKQHKSFNPTLLPRKALVCDMQKPANVLRWLWYTYKFVNRR